MGPVVIVPPLLPATAVRLLRTHDRLDTWIVGNLSGARLHLYRRPVAYSRANPFTDLGVLRAGNLPLCPTRARRWRQMPADYRPLCAHCSDRVLRILGLHNLPATDPRRANLLPDVDEVRDALLAAKRPEHLNALRPHVIARSGGHTRLPSCRRGWCTNFDLLAQRQDELGCRPRKSA